MPFVKVDDTTWRVESRSHPGEFHFVRCNAGGLSCGCKGYHYTAWCWHCQLVKNSMPPKEKVVDEEKDTLEELGYG